MARPSKHLIDRNISSRFPTSIQYISTLSEASAIKACIILSDSTILESDQLRIYNNDLESAKNDLQKFQKLNNNKNFTISNYTFKNQPSLIDMIICISYFLNFNVRSEHNIKKFFGDENLYKIKEYTNITTFKDNLRDNCGDDVLLFNLALLYCVNKINIETGNSIYTIPFFTLTEICNDITTIQYENDRVLFLYRIYKKLKSTTMNHYYLSIEMLSLYRAYEKYVPPANSLIKELIKTRKEHERKENKYNDDMCKSLKKHVNKIKQSETNLLFYIKDNITNSLDIEDTELSNLAYEQDKLVTLELLYEIKNAFSDNRAPGSLSADYFFSLLMNINSKETAENIIDIIKSLTTIEDDYILTRFYDISFHILGKNTLKKFNINNEILFEHLYNASLSDDTIYMLADILYKLFDMTDIDYSILETIIYSANLKSNAFYKIYNMILGYSRKC